jgi:hypothetical protein
MYLKFKDFLKKIHILFFSKTVIFNKNSSINHDQLTIGIAIPVSGQHVKYIEDLLTFISHSEILPDEVSISISSSSNINFNFPKYEFKLIISQISLFQNGAQNRNIAARKLNTDIISFFDVDDIPHIKRISYIKHAFNNGSSVCVHNYLKSSDRNFDFPVSNIGQLDYHHKTINSKSVDCLYPICVSSKQNYACGHISIRRDIFKKFQFDESKQFRNETDARYATRLVENNIFISYIGNRLSLYFK